MKFVSLVVQDGFPPERVIHVPNTGALKGCKDEKHCAAHGNGPFVCCKCGAEFVRDARDVRRSSISLHGGGA